MTLVYSANKIKSAVSAYNSAACAFTRTSGVVYNG